MIRKKKIILILAAFLTMNWMLLDRFVIYGVITDKATGKPIPNAIVTFTLSGDRPFIPWPHAYHSNSVCIGSYVRQTDTHGRYSLFTLALNSVMYVKRVDVHVFKPDYFLVRSQYADSLAKNVHAGLLGLPTNINVELTPDTGERWSYRSRDHDTTEPYTLDPSDQMFQLTMSRAFTENLYDMVEGNRNCSQDIWKVYLTVLTYSARIANTDAEKSNVLGTCGWLKEQASILNESRRKKKKLALIPKPIYDFPYQCDDSLFKIIPKHTTTQRYR